MNCSDVERHERGLATLRRIGGPDVAAPILALNDIAPDLVRFAIDFAFGEVLSRPGLDVKTRELCTVAALSAMRHAVPQLAWHIDAALHVGARPSEVDELTRIAASYAGDPASPDPGQPALDDITRELATVALLTALGTQPPALKKHLHASLDAGASREQVIEVIEQMAIYAGFPAALNGIAAARDVFEGR
jgi:alkylhydroperoxidase/carboxymuconolactone decarboxylase family protein YurZ